MPNEKNGSYIKALWTAPSQAGNLQNRAESFTSVILNLFRIVTYKSNLLCMVSHPGLAHGGFFGAYANDDLSTYLFP